MALWYAFTGAVRIPTPFEAPDRLTAETLARVHYGSSTTVQSCADYFEQQAELEARARRGRALISGDGNP